MTDLGLPNLQVSVWFNEGLKWQTSQFKEFLEPINNFAGKVHCINIGTEIGDGGIELYDYDFEDDENAEDFVSYLIHHYSKDIKSISIYWFNK